MSLDLSSSDDAPRVAVLGGGLAGLAAALRLTDLASEQRRQVAVTLIEAADRLGGALDTVDREGYLIDRGADSFLTNKLAAVRLCERLGIAERLIPTDNRFRGALVLRRGRPVPVPAGFNLMAPGQLWPIVTTPLLSPAGKLRLLAEPLIPRRTNATDESLSSFVRRRLGHEAFERLVQPLVSGIYTADPDRLSLAATLPRFLEMERNGGLIRGLRRAASAAGNGADREAASGARYGLFAGLRGGMRELLTALVAEVERHTTIHRHMPIASIRRDATGWTLTPEATGLHPLGPFDALILALPAYRAADLLAAVDAPLATLLNGISYASSVVVASGHRLADVQHPLDAFGLVIPTIERRDALAVSFSSRKFSDRAPEGRVLLRTFVGGATRPDLAALPDADLQTLVRRELADLLGVGGEPETMVISRYPRAMPQYHVGHLDRVREIDAATTRHTGLGLTGSAYRGVGLPDVIADAERAAAAAFDALDRFPRAART